MPFENVSKCVDWVQTIDIRCKRLFGKKCHNINTIWPPTSSCGHNGL